MGGNCSASPISADGRLYFFSRTVKTTVLAPGRQYRVLATSQLDGEQMATPAVSGQSLFLRTRTHLYRLGGSGQAGWDFVPPYALLASRLSADGPGARMGPIDVSGTFYAP
jgi:hypothetical protein